MTNQKSLVIMITDDSHQPTLQFIKRFNLTMYMYA
eukprot:CAMPEP_0201972074 /NCGR_PEP_ID=MMETSP0904-20121228/40056_1 /ASSEMBLY_ACC=CAM_ASM_000553 /TAXON_ID=420261 /ORGANISM="Thalassiosira antarctica, Strain CCMP982" /LENGTH=34 /DNA_ID= /DNA_START= /DNA_END= /DNA_ORIENTATION=